MPDGCFDAIVVGAGIVGAACARELAREGMRVAVVEAAEFPGSGATAAGMGHVAVMDDSEPQFALTHYSQRLWQELASELPADAEYLSCGSLWVAADEEEMAEVHRKFQFYTDRGLPVEVLDGQEVAAAEPQLRHGLAGALRMPGDGVCYPPCAARFLLDQVTRSGGQVFYRETVTSLSDSGVTTASGKFFSSVNTIVATGTAARTLLPSLPIVPRKGHLVITERRPDFLHHQIIELGYLKSAGSTKADSVAFNAQPRTTGQILIGSSRQYGPEDGVVETAMLSRMLARAVEYMPDLSQTMALRVWTGFRAATPDKLPLIGVCPGFSNVYLATGHEGLGISTSLATARLLADEIAHRPSMVDRKPYAANRVFASHA